MDCSPKTQRIASDIFDFPLPFGPTIPVIGLSKDNRVLSGNDLKPCISIDFKYSYNTGLSNGLELSFKADIAAACSASFLLLPVPLP